MIIYGQDYRIKIIKQIPKNISISGNSIKYIDVNDYQMFGFGCYGSGDEFVCRFYESIFEDGKKHWNILNEKYLICKICSSMFYNLYNFLYEILELPIKYKTDEKKWIVEESLIVVENNWK